MARPTLAEAVRLLDRYTTGDITGYCTACRDLIIRRGGRTPNVLDGEPHLPDCPIGQFRERVAKAKR